MYNIDHIKASVRELKKSKKEQGSLISRVKNILWMAADKNAIFVYYFDTLKFQNSKIVG